MAKLKQKNYMACCWETYHKLKASNKLKPNTIQARCAVGTLLVWSGLIMAEE